MKPKVYFKYDANLVGIIFILLQSIPKIKNYCGSFFTVLERGKYGEDGEYNRKILPIFELIIVIL